MISLTSANRIIIIYILNPRIGGNEDVDGTIAVFADTSKIRRLLGWPPKVSLPDGVQVMLELHL